VNSAPQPNPDNLADETEVETRLWWGRELFLSGYSPPDACPETFDITGAARHLMFGPYIELTGGLWRATAELELCPDAARARLAVEWGSEPHYSSAMLEPGQAGLRTIALCHRIDRPQRMQLRLWLKKAAFHGTVSFVGVTVERLRLDSARCAGARI